MMRAAAAVVFAVFGTASLGDAAMAAGHDPYRWTFRPVLVFAPDASHPALIRQKQVIGAARGPLRERDIAVVYVVGNDVSHELGPSPGKGASALRETYGVGRTEFRAVLVGKDGGVKLRSSSPFTVERLSSVIDAMPMRKQEMREAR